MNFYSFYTAFLFPQVDKESAPENRGSSVSSSWSKKDIKVLFSPEKSETPPLSRMKYQKCETDEDDAKRAEDDEEAIDLTLASPDDTSFQNETELTHVTVDSDALENELTTAAEGIVRTFPSPSGSKMLMTDMWRSLSL